MTPPPDFERLPEEALSDGSLPDGGLSGKPPQNATRSRRGRKALFVVATAIAAGAALANAAVNILHTRAPDLALAIDTNDPVALIRKAELERAAGLTQRHNAAHTLSVVQRSVTRLPLNGPAFRLYGLSSVANADLDAVRAQMLVSDRMERRDVGAQLWLIENAVEDNDVNGALRHYDRALRIEESASALLFPTLTDAMDSALIRERFAPLMASNPPWLARFLRFAVSKSRNPVSLAELARARGGWPKGAAFSSLDTELLARLVGNGDFAAAADHFRRIDGADPSILKDLRITDASTNQRWAPIAWQPFQSDGVEAYFLASSTRAGGVEIEADIEAGFKGALARKFFALEPGTYRLSATMRAEDFAWQDVARWKVTCAGTGAGEDEKGASSSGTSYESSSESNSAAVAALESGSGANSSVDAAPLTLLDQTVAFEDKMELSAPLIVPADCPVQRLLLSAETLVTTRYVKLIVAEASLAPVARPSVSLDVGVRNADEGA